ncbi:MAG: ATP-binding cassette domain-containing protein, partial [Bacteroidales bacterium]|nr:ATP-binding cassette domain-containing protein [Bacteroidales bacterium]
MEEAEYLFAFENALLSRNGTRQSGIFNWKVGPGESWWICGANGSGKTTLLEMLTGRHRISEGVMKIPAFSSPEAFYSSVTLVRRDFSLNQVFNRSAVFYQQRYFSQGLEETPAVIDFLVQETGIAEDIIRSAASESGFEHILEKRIVSLSTGEGRRVLLLMLLLSGRKIICFDDPYSGLDSEGCAMVSDAFRSLLEKNVTIMASGAGTQPPAVFDHVLYLKDQTVLFAGRAEDFIALNNIEEETREVPGLVTRVNENPGCNFSTAAAMNNITIRYNNKVVQKDFSWHIKRGDKWLLTGPNGSGKSTLMSLIYGDNPMTYAYELVVFDRVRGSGETIWEIKKPMGYFSSELQQFFPLSMTLYEAVLTGFSDHLTVRKDLTDDHLLQARELIEAAGLSDYSGYVLSRLSFSQRRLALVCRAFVKHPPVVILDEPCQGLD